MRQSWWMAALLGFPGISGFQLRITINYCHNATEICTRRERERESAREECNTELIQYGSANKKMCWISWWPMCLWQETLATFNRDPKHILTEEFIIVLIGVTWCFGLFYYSSNAKFCLADNSCNDIWLSLICPTAFWLLCKRIAVTD